MDNTTLAIYIHELRNQCLYTDAAFRVFNQSIEQRANAGVFFAAQAILQSASQVSGILWPTRARAKKRGEHIRQALQLPEKHALSNKNLSSLWEHSDEKLEDWIGETKGQQIVFDHLGPLDQLNTSDIPDGNVYRLYDPKTMTFYYRGDGYKMQIIADAISDVYSRVTSIHKRMFPDHYNQEGASTAAPDTAKAEKKEKKPASKKKAAPKKKATPKKAATKKSPVKKK